MVEDLVTSFQSSFRDYKELRTTTFLEHIMRNMTRATYASHLTGVSPLDSGLGRWVVHMECMPGICALERVSEEIEARYRRSQKRVW